MGEKNLKILILLFLQTVATAYQCPPGAEPGTPGPSLWTSSVLDFGPGELFPCSGPRSWLPAHLPIPAGRQHSKPAKMQKISWKD